MIIRSDKMKHEQERTTIRHERVAGADYGKTFGGVYYRNLEHYQDPVREYIGHTHSRSYSLADIGGGSGIVGCSLLRTVLDSGNNGILDVLDINPKQLEGVAVEAERLGIPPESVNAIKHDLLTDCASQYDITSMRKVLHYFDGERNEEVIRKLPQYLTEGGLFVLGSLVGEDQDDSRYKEEILDGIEEFLAGNSGFSRRCVLEEDNLRHMLEKVGFRCIRQTSYIGSIPMRSLQEKFGLSDEFMKDINKVERSRLDRLGQNDLWSWKTGVYMCVREK